jgi:hypothetical protein
VFLTMKGSVYDNYQIAEILADLVASKERLIMKSLLVMLIALTSFGVAAQDNTNDPEARNREIFQAFGFCYGQQKSVDHIKREFPNLSIPMFQAETSFGITFGKSCKAIGDLLGEPIQRKLRSEFDQYISFRAISETVAKEFISKIDARSKGDIVTPIKETLLTFNPDFRSVPALEFTRGFTRTYSTAGHAKAAGLTIDFKVPMSWISREGNHPHVVQFFAAEYGRSDATMGILITPVPTKGARVTQREINSMFSPTNIKDLVPEGAVLIESKPITLEGQKGAMLLYDMTANRLDLSISVRTLSYTIFYKNHLLTFDFGVGSLTENQAESLKVFAKYRPLFGMIANSIVLSDANTLRMIRQSKPPKVGGDGMQKRT